MIPTFVNKFEENKQSISDYFQSQIDLNLEDFSYKNIVEAVIDTFTDCDYEFDLDKERLREIDDGDYQGNILYLVPTKAYQPGAGQYFYVFVGYGSCSGCDTLQRIKYDEEKDQQLKDLMTLALHIVQGFKVME